MASITRSVLSDRVRDSLSRAVVSGRCAPGSRSVETRVARQLGVSQTPVREAPRDMEAHVDAAVHGRVMEISANTTSNRGWRFADAVAGSAGAGAGSDAARPGSRNPARRHPAGARGGQDRSKEHE